MIVMEQNSGTSANKKSTELKKIILKHLSSYMYGPAPSSRSNLYPTRYLTGLRALR